MRIRQIVLAMASLIFSPLLWAESNSFALVPVTADDQAIATAERSFLKGLGFEDYGLEAGATLQAVKAKAGVSPLVVPVLQSNYNHLIPLSYAREAGVLARVGLERAKAEGREGEALQKLSKLTAYHLLPFALLGLEPIPEAVYNHKTGPVAAQLREKYLSTKAVARYLREKKAFIATYLEMLFTTKELSQKTIEVQSAMVSLDKMISEILRPQYEYTALQQSRYLGRALVATLLKYTRERGYASMEAKLKTALAAEGEALENHITSTLSLRDRARRLTKIEVFNGDIVNEYSAAGDAYQIAVGVLPGKSNQAKAAELKLVGSLAYFGSALSTGIFERAIEKKKSNQALNEDEERVLREVWNQQMIRGFSHAGLAEVRRDPGSGLSMVWIWDIYPLQGLGGMRLQTPENFAYPERHNRIGFVHYNPGKALEAFKKQYKARGYLPVVWESFAARLLRNSDGDLEFGVNTSKKVSRKTFVDRATVESWLQVQPAEASRWYSEEIVPRAMTMMRRYLTGEEAVSFSVDFKNADHTAYCSQLILLAFLQGANFDLQSEPDIWRGVSKVAAKFGALELTERIVSPSGFAWQKDLVDTVKIVDLDRTRVAEQMQNALHVNGKLTVQERRLQVLESSDFSKSSEVFTEATLTPLDPEHVDVDDDNI